MKLTPMDINNKEFKRGIRGYSPDEVDEFLEEIVESYEELYKENSKLKEKLSSAQEQIEHYSEIQNTIQNTLMLAQNAADQAKSTAEKEAELVVKTANETAQRIVDKAHNDVIQINDEFDRAKKEFIKFRNKFRNFMNTQLDTFDDLERDLNKSYSISTPVEELEVNNTNSEVDLTFKSIDEEVITEDINEIKSFFAGKDSSEE